MAFEEESKIPEEPNAKRLTSALDCGVSGWEWIFFDRGSLRAGSVATLLISCYATFVKYSLYPTKGSGSGR